MAEIYTVRSILGDESLQNLINQGKSQDEIISIAKAYKDEAIKSGDKDALNRMNLVNGKQGRADFFTRLGDKMDANGYETMGSIARGIDILASKAAAPIAGLMGDSDKEAQILADMKLTQSINEAKKLDEIATTPRTQREYMIDSNNLLANAIGSYTKESKTYARNLVEQAENSGYTAMDRFNIGMATTANATKYFIKSLIYGEDSKQARDIKDAQKILQASRDAYEANNPDKWNVANFAGEMVTDPLNAVGLAKGFKVANTAFKKGANVAFDLAQLGAIGGMAGAISEYGSYKDKDEQNVAGAAMMGAGAGVALGAGFMALGAVLGKIASRFGQKSTLEQNAQMAKDETTKELEKGTPQDIDKRLQKISDDIEEAFSADENAENIARLLGQEYDDNINKAIKESQEVSTAIDDNVAKFANDNPKASASDIEIYINKTYAPSQSEKELTRIINDDKPVTPRMAGYRVLGVLQKTMEYKTRFEREVVVKRFKNHGFNDELANVFADAYTADDISVARRYLDSKVASNRQKSVEDGRNEWLKSTTKSNKAKTPKNQDEILKEISSDKTQFKLIDDSDMTAELKSRLENDGYTLEREPESGVWEVSKASDKIAKDEVKSDGDGFIASDDNIKDLVKNISLNKDIAMQLQPKADLLKLVKDFSNVIKTPIFESKISIDKLLNHLADKNSDKRLEYLNLIKPTLENPLFITKENNRYRFVKTFIDSDKITKFLSVIENDNGEFIGITATPIKNTDLKNLLKGDIVWGGDTLSTLNAPQIAKQEVEAMSETIPNQDLKSTDVANVSDEIGINSTKGNFKSNPLSTPYSDAGLAVKAQDTRDGVRPNASIAKTDEKTIPNQDLKSADVAELTFQDKKGKDHIITKEIQKEWIDTFGLKNLDDTYIPKFNNEIKKALGNKELKLQKGSLLKLVSQGRQKFIPEIKKVLDDPEIIITDKNGEIILAKHLKDKDYFVNVSFDHGEYLISISNGIKEINNLNNKIKQGGKILYQSPNANSISQTLLQTSQYSANKIDVAPVSTPKNDLDRTLSNRYDSSNSTPKEIKSQEPTTQPMMNGFSTMAMQKAILHLGSGGIGGVMNANAEQDPNKKAEAFVKGFLLGAGGSVGAMKMLENSAKLAPQLARTSQRLAKDLPMILNDRPDIIGKVLGRTPKDNYNYIFGGENAIGANKAKLKTAQEMAKNGADESQIWAKTGWYKDIDKKWKFEINPQGGELKENAISNHITKVKSIEKEISELEKIKDGWGNIEQRIEAGDKIKELKKQKDKLQVNVGDILDDKMLFTSYPELKNIQVVFNNYDGGASYGGKIELSRALEPTMMKSVLYHELQHEIQIIERFANGGGYFADKTEVEELLKKYPNDADLKNLYDGLENDYIYEDAEFNVYNKLAGEAEARNVQTRLTANSKEHPNKTLDINPNDRIVKYDSYMSASYTPKQKEVRGVYNVLKNGKQSTRLYKDITADLNAVDNIVKFEKGKKDYRTKTGYKNGYGLEHIKKHLGADKNGYVTEQELLHIGDFMRSSKMSYIKEYKNGKERIKRVYESFDNEGTRFRVLVGENEKGDTTISFFSNRKAQVGFTHNAENYTNNLKGSVDNSTTTTNKSQELNLSRAERRAMGIEEPKGKTLVIDEKAVKNDVREFGRLAHQVGLGFKSAKEAKAVMDKCDKSKFDCGS